MNRTDAILIKLEREGKVSLMKGTERIDIECVGRGFLVSVNYVPMKRNFTTSDIVELVRNVVGE